MSNKLKVISDISRDMGQVFFASAVIGPIFSGSINGFLLIIGLAFASAFWYASIIIIKE